MVSGASRIPTVLAAVLLGLGVPTMLHAQALEFIQPQGSTNAPLHVTPALPSAALYRAPDGNFYGTSLAGGEYGMGTVFRMTPDGTVTVLHSSQTYVHPTGGTGVAPQVPVVMGHDGLLYGSSMTTDLPTARGSVRSVGWIFRISPNAPDGVASLLGSLPDLGVSAPPMLSSDGYVYFAYHQTGRGAMFRFPKNGCCFFNLPFEPGTKVGSMSAPVEGHGGLLYGTTSQGGALNRGLLYRWSPPDQPPTIVHQFAGGAGPANPRALTLGSDGSLYGVSQAGGAFNAGTVFRATLDGEISVLHSFPGGAGGRAPTLALKEGADGNFYGVADGGAFDRGIVFRMTPSGNVTILHAFTGGPTDGDSPRGSLIDSGDGAFYGTTERGGAVGLGTVYRITMAGVVSLVHSFGSGVHGAMPSAVALGGDGSYYGTTVSGGALRRGTVFRATPSPSGGLSTIHAFGVDGSHPVAGLLRAADGYLYGTTSQAGVVPLAGASDFGTVFKMSPSGAVTVLHVFRGGATDGGWPMGALTQATDGTILGTTAGGGFAGAGTVFRVAPTGGVTLVHEFGGSGGGARPEAPLVQGSDGNFYGTTLFGGAFNRGTVFRLTPQGAMTPLHIFTGGLDGAYPRGGLVQASDGRLYGVTTSNGGNAGGTLFRVPLDGPLTTLHAFTRDLEGSAPQASLIQGSDGLLYGTTLEGGRFGLGSVFRITLGGSLTVLAMLGPGDGHSPRTSLLEVADGVFLGTTSAGGPLGGGVVFRLDLHARAVRPSALTIGPASFGQLRLRWTSVATAHTYTVKRAIGTGPYVALATGLTDFSFVDAGVERGRRYRYLVSAVNAAGEGIASYEVSATAGRAADGDYDGDSRADVGVFRPSTGAWFIHNSATGTVRQQLWGGSIDRPVRGDFDGDGIQDIAVFRPPTGTWYINPSTTGATVARLWGGSSDTPVPGDYDGDLRTDIAVFRESTGTWYIEPSSTGGSLSYAWGGSGAIPVQGDYDGDGKTDIGVFRPSTGGWYILTSSGAGLHYVFGAASDTPVPADYDGDGKADIGVRRPAAAGDTWSILASATQTGLSYRFGYRFGATGDVPVPGDFNGDGLTDIAVFRAPTGSWFILGQPGYFGGRIGDIPLLGRP